MFAYPIFRVHHDFQNYKVSAGVIRYQRNSSIAKWLTSPRSVVGHSCGIHYLWIICSNSYCLWKPLPCSTLALRNGCAPYVFIRARKCMLNFIVLIRQECWIWLGCPSFVYNHTTMHVLLFCSLLIWLAKIQSSLSLSASSCQYSDCHQYN